LIGADTPQAKALLDTGLSPGTLRDLAHALKVFSRKVLELYQEEGEVEDGQITPTGRENSFTRYFRLLSNGPEITALDTIADQEFRLFAAEYPDLYPLAWQAEKTRVLAMLKRFTA